MGHGLPPYACVWVCMGVCLCVCWKAMLNRVDMEAILRPGCQGIRLKSKVLWPSQSISQSVA